VADHVTVLDVGRVVMDGDAKDIDDMSVLRDAYFGHTAGQNGPPGSSGDGNAPTGSGATG